jgi:predicted porin
MRKTQLALAALALAASSAVLADGVTVYGTVDASVVSGDAGGPQLAGAGNSAGSILGFRGSEDLGGGLKANFNLETGYSASNGSLNNGGNLSSTSIFNRVASVGLSTETIGINLGNQISPYIVGELTGATAVGGNGIFVPGLYILNGGNLAGMTTAATGGTGGFFIPEAVNLSANVAGFSANLLSRLGGGGSAENKYTAGSLSTAVAGANVALAHQKISANGTDTKNTVLAANYAIGDIRINGAYATNSIGNADNKGYLIGASMPVSGALSAGVTYAKNDLASLDDMLAGSLQYNLSKSTYAYANYAKFGNRNIAVKANHQGRIGTTDSLITVGVAHSF